MGLYDQHINMLEIVFTVPLGFVNNVSTIKIRLPIEKCKRGFIESELQETLHRDPMLQRGGRALAVL